MAQLQIVIGSIFDGLAPSGLFGEDDQYQAGIGIDPDIPITDSATDLKTGGVIRPVNYAAFSSANVDSYPIAIIKNPKNTYTYAVLRNGKIFRYDSSQANETLVGTVAAGVACGAFYYNNYIYVVVPTDVSRYGPLDGTAALTDGVWTGATLGSLTALTNTPYPTSLLGVSYLNHFGVVHLDGAAYFVDFKNGVGMIHKIQTIKGTNEGDTNSGSAYNILDLPPNYLPISIASMGNDMVVSASLTTDGSVTQGGAALFFFNPSDTIPSFYRQVYIPYDICSVLKYANGVPYGISGSLNGSGYSIFKYLGGDTIETLKIVEGGYPPLQGASESVANKLIWGANMSSPMVSSGLLALGSKSDLFPRGLHHIALSAFTS